MEGVYSLGVLCIDFGKANIPALLALARAAKIGSLTGLHIPHLYAVVILAHFVRASVRGISFAAGVGVASLHEWRGVPPRQCVSSFFHTSN